MKLSDVKDEAAEYNKLVQDMRDLRAHLKTLPKNELIRTIMYLLQAYHEEIRKLNDVNEKLKSYESERKENA